LSRNIEKLLKENPEAKFYCMGKKPNSIKAAVEYLEFWQTKNYRTFNYLSEKYDVHEKTISNHARELGVILGILPSTFKDFYSYTFRHGSSGLKKDYYFEFDWTCKNCGASNQQVGDNKIWKFCPYCGKPIIVQNKKLDSC